MKQGGTLSKGEGSVAYYQKERQSSCSFLVSFFCEVFFIAPPRESKGRLRGVLPLVPLPCEVRGG